MKECENVQLQISSLNEATSYFFTIAANVLDLTKNMYCGGIEVMFVLLHCGTRVCWQLIAVYLSTLNPTENNVGRHVTPLRVKQNYS